MTSKELPFSLESEQSLLGSMLINENIIPSVKCLLAVDDFYPEKHQNIFSAILQAKNKDLVSIWNLIDKEKVDKRYYLDLTSVTTSAAWEYHTEQIIKDSKKRKIWALGCELKEQSALHHSDVEEILSTAKNGLSSIEKDNRIEDTNNEKLFSDTYRGIFEKQEPGLYTGITGIDDKFYFENGYIHTIAAESGIGKSALLLQISDHIAETYGKKVLFYSLESTREKLARRLICRHAEVALTRINKNDFRDETQIADIMNVCDDLSKSNLKIYDNSNFIYIERLISHAESYFLNNDVSMICIDFLQALESIKSFSSDRSKINYFISRIKTLAKELNIPIVYACQLRKDIQGRPKLDDLIESNYIRTHTDNILFLYAPDSDPAVYPVECYLGKGKEQERFFQWLEFNGHFQKFYKGTPPVPKSSGVTL